LRTQEAPYRILLQRFDWLECSIADIAEQLDQLRGKGVNRDRGERRDMPRDLSQVDQTPKLFLQSFVNNLSIWKNLKRMRLMEVTRVLPITIGKGPLNVSMR
jgi:hypothetical protein